ncbi:MAG: HAD family hydrolase, partial [Chitinophagaceae bacterium]
EILARILDDRHLTEREMHDMVTKKDARYRALYRPHLALIDGLQQFLDAAVGAGIRMAIASGSTPENVDMVLDGLNIRHYFKAIVSGAEVKKSKPDPATFIMAAKKLAADPTDCIVFEDMPQGVEAARRGGMMAVAILTTHPQESFAPYSNLLNMIHDYRSTSVTELIGLAQVQNADRA